jgi:hypothetical protein
MTQLFFICYTLGFAEPALNGCMQAATTLVTTLEGIQSGASLPALMASVRLWRYSPYKHPNHCLMIQ